MADKTTVELGPVQKTLLLPLWGRAVETRKEEPLLVDKTAVEIIDRLDYDFSTIAANISAITQLAWIARSIHIDRTIHQFLEKHPKATIVNIGCGLDTTFQRVDNGVLLWYDLDLPDVIRLRREFMKEGERNRCLACSCFDQAWFHQVRVEDAVLFLAAGVFYYFEEKQIKDFFTTLANVFPESEIVLDVASPLAAKVANKVVIKAGGMDESSILKWGVKTAKTLEGWDRRTEVLEEYPMFKHMKKTLNFKNKIGTLESDLLKIMSMVHLKFARR